MTDGYKDLLERIDALADDPRALIYDAEINRHLEPLRLSGPFGSDVANPRAVNRCRGGRLTNRPQLFGAPRDARRRTRQDSEGSTSSWILIPILLTGSHCQNAKPWPNNRQAARLSASRRTLVVE